MILTIEKLKKLGASEEGINFFKTMFPNNIEYSVELHKKFLKNGFTKYEEWAVKNRFIPPLKIEEDYGPVITGYKGVSFVMERGAAKAGHYGTAEINNDFTAEAGHYGLAKANDYAKAITGSFGTSVTRHRSLSKTEAYGTAKTENYSTAIAGYKGTAIAKKCGLAIAGDYGTAMVGEYGTAIAGNYGTAIAEDCGKASAGIGGIIKIVYWSKLEKHILVGHIGQNNLLPNIKYKIEYETLRFIPV